MSLGAALRDFNVSADLREQRTSLRVSGWDEASKSAITQEADESAINGELDGGESGASILRLAFGERRESVNDTAPAEALFRMGARQFVTGRGIADSSALLRVGAYVDLQGLGPLFSGKYYVIEVHHLFDPAKGMRTEFAAERPGLGRP